MKPIHWVTASVVVFVALVVIVVTIWDVVAKCTSQPTVTDSLIRACRDRPLIPVIIGGQVGLVEGILFVHLFGE